MTQPRYEVSVLPPSFTMSESLEIHTEITGEPGTQNNDLEETKMFEDKTLTCRDCGEEFLFSASEQQFFADKGFQNEPSRCPACRAARRAAQNPNRGERQMYEVICDGCGVTTQVPFQPRGDRPVYCRECFERNRQSQY